MKLSFIGWGQLFCDLCNETLLQSLDVFCASRKFLYIIKNKAPVFSSFLGLFYMFIICPPPPPPAPQSFVHLAFQYSPPTLIPVSNKCSWNQTAFYILLQLIQSVSDCIYKFYNFSTSEYMLLLPRSIINTCNRISSSLWTWASHIQTSSIFYYTVLMDKQKM